MKKYLFSPLMCVLFSNVAFADGIPKAETKDVLAGTKTVVTKPSVAKPLNVKPSAPYKSTVVDPSIAIKSTPAKEIDLPGVMKLEGEDLNFQDPSKVREISMNNHGGSQTVWISRTEPNRIQLPFKNPKIVTVDGLIEVDKKPTSNNVYITVERDADAIPLFLEAPNNDNGVLSLQLIPKDIPAQTIIVRDDTTRQPKRKANNEYVAGIQNVFEVIANGGIPDGYSRTPFDMQPASFNGLMVQAEQRLSNQDGDIYIYTVTNIATAKATVLEHEFDAPNVLAVSIFPTPVIAPNQKTRVIVLAKKGEQ